jgi:hypothetical protein
MDSPKYPMRIGEDRIVCKGENLLVCSKFDMEEWQVQELRKTGIYINDELWHLAGKQTAEKEIRYLLAPWPEYHKEIPGRIIRYNEDYVKARDAAEKKKQIEEGVGPILYHFRVIIGFLPSGLKSRLESDFGVPARNATLLSIILEFFLFLLLGAFLQIFAYGAMGQMQLVESIPFFIVPVLVLLFDLIMRYHSYLHEDASPWGFLEWLIRRRIRSAKQ